jgi:cell division septation protein DedD
VSDDEERRERKGAEGRGRGGRRRGPGLASALAGAGLLVVLGFALGVVGGLVMEEPDLLLDYLLGRTEQVAVVEESVPAVASVPDVAARPPEESPSAVAEVEVAAAEVAPAPTEVEAVAVEAEEALPAAAPAEEPAPAPVVAAVAPAGGFAVQVGAFAESSAAEQLARRLRDAGLPVYIAPSAGTDTARWRVRVGPLSSRAEAESVAARLEREQRLSTWVLAESPL